MLKRLLLAVVLFPIVAFAQDFKAGKDYQVLPKAESSKAGNKEITEFFSYGCPWCYKVEKPLKQWQKAQGQSITLQRVPVVFHKDWEMYAKAYYLANILHKNAELDPILFKAIQDDKMQLSTAQAMQAFLKKQGLDEQLIHSAFDNSPTMDVYLKQGNNQMAESQINAVPAFVINGHYKTDLQMAGSPERLIAILSYLSEKK